MSFGTRFESVACFLTFCRPARICSKAGENEDANSWADSKAPGTVAVSYNIADSTLCRNLHHLEK